MDLHLYDTARGEVTKVAQRDPGKLSIYACGPTVYDLPHIGHGRMVLTYDILRRYVESRGVEVHHVSNITDIEDKIINRAKETRQSTEQITTTYERAWYDAVDKLNVLRPHEDPHATAYVKQMIDLIAELVANGYAYETSDTVYFQPEKVEGYGLLARQSIDSLRAGARVVHDEEKRSPIDFALWKKIEPPVSEPPVLAPPVSEPPVLAPTWDSPWGPGRPGWHTECVVMSLDLLGDGFDIHAGGLDLAFPHHENERAQAVAAGKKFARHWMHNGFVEMGGEKMSKSLGNFTTLTDLLEKTDPRAYRMLVLRSHYRSPIEVTPETIADAESAVERLDGFARRFAGTATNSVEEHFLSAFNKHMDNDMDTPKAVAELFTLLREANADLDAGNQAQANVKARAVLNMAKTFGLTFEEPDTDTDAVTAELIDRRDGARAAKDWAAADTIRGELQALGWTVEDTAEGTQVHR